MEIIDISVEVIFDHIFPYLQLNDFLRLRRVCKFTKEVAEDYLRLHVTSKEGYFSTKPDTDPERNLSALLALDFVVPYSRFYISNKSNKTWEHEQFQRFVELYGKKITHLEIAFLEIPIVSRKAIKFFESLPNLEHLEIRVVDERGWRSRKKKMIQARASNMRDLPNLIPSTFRRLKTLIINDHNCPEIWESAQLIWNFVEECSPHLRYLRHPDSWNLDLNVWRLPGGRFGHVIKMLETGAAPDLEFYDIMGSNEDYYDAPIRDFYLLVTACSKRNVKLLNVEADLIDDLMRFETWDMEEHGSKISKVVVSLICLHVSSFLLELPHLEEIDISALTGTEWNCSMPHWQFERKAWPNLKKLNIHVNSEYLLETDGEHDVKTQSLLDFLFVGIYREKLECLKLTFHHGEEHLNETLPYPRIRDVWSSCPNLKKLTLGEWIGSNREVSRMWNNLPLLEEVEFRGCEDLGDEAFLGDYKLSPSLLKAKNLQTLKLKHLEKMPKVTDKLFSLVLRHMPLRKLYLHSASGSDKPLDSISIGGITSLIIGSFSQTIEKLALNVKLDGVTEDEMAEIECNFRSCDMMQWNY